MSNTEKKPLKIVIYSDEVRKKLSENELLRTVYFSRYGILDIPKFVDCRKELEKMQLKLAEDIVARYANVYLISDV